MEEKRTTLKQLDEEILDLVEEDAIDDEIELADTLKVGSMLALLTLRVFSPKHLRPLHLLLALLPVHHLALE